MLKYIVVFLLASCYCRVVPQREVSMPNAFDSWPDRSANRHKRITGTIRVESSDRGEKEFLYFDKSPLNSKKLTLHEGAIKPIFEDTIIIKLPVDYCSSFEAYSSISEIKMLWFRISDKAGYVSLLKEGFQGDGFSGVIGNNNDFGPRRDFQVDCITNEITVFRKSFEIRTTGRLREVIFRPYRSPSQKVILRFIPDKEVHGVILPPES